MTDDPLLQDAHAAAEHFLTTRRRNQYILSTVAVIVAIVLVVGGVLLVRASNSAKDATAAARSAARVAAEIRKNTQAIQAIQATNVCRSVLSADYDQTFAAVITALFSQPFDLDAVQAFDGQLTRIAELREASDPCVGAEEIHGTNPNAPATTTTTAPPPIQPVPTVGLPTPTVSVIAPTTAVPQANAQSAPTTTCRPKGKSGKCH